MKSKQKKIGKRCHLNTLPRTKREVASGRNRTDTSPHLGGTLLHGLAKLRLLVTDNYICIRHTRSKTRTDERV